MSNDTNTKLREDFMETLEPVIVCPYCGSPNQLDPPLLCCGEVHATEAYEDAQGEIIYDNELEEAFQRWLLRSATKHLIHPDTKRLTIRAKHDIAMAGTLDLYEVLNELFKLGYGNLSESEIYTIKDHLERQSNKADRILNGLLGEEH